MTRDALLVAGAVLALTAPPVSAQDNLWPRRFEWWESIDTNTISGSVFEDAVDRIFEENWETSTTCAKAKRYARAAVGSTRYYWGVPKDPSIGGQWFGSRVVIHENYKNYGSKNLADKIVHEAWHEGEDGGSETEARDAEGCLRRGHDRMRLRRRYIVAGLS